VRKQGTGGVICGLTEGERDTLRALNKGELSRNARKPGEALLDKKGKRGRLTRRKIVCGGEKGAKDRGDSQ